MESEFTPSALSKKEAIKRNKCRETSRGGASKGKAQNFLGDRSKDITPTILEMLPTITNIGQTSALLMPRPRGVNEKS